MRLDKYLGGRTFWRSMLALAVPIALQQLLISSFSLVDTFMVSQLGDVALSSVGMAGQWVWMLNMVFFGFGSGGAVFAAQYFGVRDLKSIRHVYGITLTFCFLATIPFCLAGFFIPELVISIFNRTPAVVASGASYLSIVIFSYPAVMLSNIFSVFLRCTERVRLPMIVAFVTTSFNAFLNYALIFGKFGLPEMGVEGAALATCISSWCGPILILLFSLIKKNILIAPLKAIFGFSKAQVKQFLRKAGPVVGNEVFWGAGTFLFAVVFSNFGHEEYAGLTVLKTYENIAFCMFIGLCNSATVLIGKNIGLGRIKEADADAFRYSVLMPLFSVLVGVTMIIFRAPLIELFNYTDRLSDVAIQTAAGAMLLFALDMPLRNFSYLQIVGIYRSGGDTKTGAKIDTFSLWALAVPATLIAAFWIKAPFLVVYMVMFIFEDVLQIFFCIRHYRSKNWIKPVTEQGRLGLEAYKKELNTNKKPKISSTKS